MNVYLSPEGKLLSHVKAETHPKLAMLQLVDTSEAGQARSGQEEGDTLEYTRIWMAVEPPAGGAPPYAAVVGERFDGKWGRQRRPLVLLDEATCVPRMVRDEEQGGQVFKELQYPDMQDFIEAVIALKDMYHVDRFFGVPQREEQKLDYERPKQGWFYTALESVHGLQWYEDGLEEWQLKEQFPFYHSREVTAGLSHVPHAEDEELCLYALNSLFSHDRLEVRPHCKFFDDNLFPATQLAVGRLALALEFYPWVEDLNETTSHGAGYDRSIPDDAPPAVRRQALRRQVAKLALDFQAGGAIAPQAMHRKLQAGRARRKVQPEPDAQEGFVWRHRGRRR